MQRIENKKPYYKDIPALAGTSLFHAAYLAGGYLLLSGLWQLKQGASYGLPLNQALVFFLWSLVIRLGLAVGNRTNNNSLSLWLVLLIAATSQGLAWLGLSSRGVIETSWPGALKTFTPFLVALGLTLAGLALLRLKKLNLDRVILTAILGLYALGLTMLQRVGTEYSGQGSREILTALAERHVVWFGAGLAAMLATAYWGSRSRLIRLSRKKFLLPVSAAVLLIITWLAGPEINGRRLWLSLGLFSMQTVEPAKFMVVLFTAFYFAHEYPFLTRGSGGPGFERFIQAAGPFSIMLGLPLLALVVQKDFGPVMLLTGFFLIMLYLATGARSYPLVCLLIILALGWVCYHCQIPKMLFVRVENWLAPFETSEQLSRGLWSIASGGIWGTGWGTGQPHTVPLAYSDYVFAAFSEEMGFAGMAGVLGLICILVCRGMYIASQAKDIQSKLIAAGITVMITLQAFLVMGGVTGLIPLAGLTLPFMSYGGSSLIVNLTMAGLLMRVAADEKIS